MLKGVVMLTFLDVLNNVAITLKQHLKWFYLVGQF